MFKQFFLLFRSRWNLREPSIIMWVQCTRSRLQFLLLNFQLVYINVYNCSEIIIKYSKNKYICLILIIIRDQIISKTSTIQQHCFCPRLKFYLIKCKWQWKWPHKLEMNGLSRNKNKTKIKLHNSTNCLFRRDLLIETTSEENISHLTYLKEFDDWTKSDLNHKTIKNISIQNFHRIVTTLVYKIPQI